MSEKYEEMKSFFDARVSGYDEKMAATIEEYDNFYRNVATPIEKTDKPIEVLDLGAGTGIELEYIFENAPNARITAVDLSEEMLKKLVKKYEAHHKQIRTIADSYLSIDLAPHSYDYIVTVMSLHHLMPAKKIYLYKKLREALISGGAFIEGDYIVSTEEEKRLLNEFYQYKKNNPLIEDGEYHIDIPFSEEAQMQALKDAGFQNVNVLFRTPRANVVVANV
ncbi:MAG: class I SAM-dependent methyltransferase [Desulfatiglans sp.]|nr:class I SAM-dependent methyltransferase [Desulfatiglans sp.]